MLDVGPKRNVQLPQNGWITIMNIVWVGAAFFIGCCRNIRNGAAIAAHADIGCRRLWF